ncbi:hypothetical protein C2S51_024121 [Perilla frutescens var. frutescens]|nr:hypothetical protein C2S51_024121 [Perilla frutescens var. frutescens]
MYIMRSLSSSSTTTKKTLFSLLILSLTLGDFMVVNVTGDEIINTAGITCERRFVPRKEVEQDDIGSKYDVHIVNNLPSSSNSPLLIHCASGDDDLGDHSLGRTCDFNWSFRMNFFLTTKFFCRFRWEGKNVAHDVFSDRLGDGCFPIDNHVRYRCTWLVKADGFYLENVKVYDCKMKMMRPISSSSTTKNTLFSLLILSLTVGDFLIPNVTGEEIIDPAIITCERSIPRKEVEQDGISKYTVHIVNNLPNNSNNPLLIHCASGDDDLGNHSLARTCDFNWSFRMNFFWTTLFFCRFRWEGKNVAHDVFTDKLSYGCFPIDGHDFRCRWEIRQF